ncbi:SLATT domain-containing protein [Ferrimonas marina]|uniref:SLATT domain-containing protein n=1 Tax=Ferrimonas marina TaxID=299255 RepID=UPI000934313F|nr:DUF4231 domain-containing protein [Ferrimonas marina]
MKENESQERKQSETALERVKEKQKGYKVRAYIFQTIHFILGGLSVSLAAVLANKAIPEWATTEGFAAIVAVTAALSTFLRPDSKAKKYNTARSILRRARNQYVHDNDPLVRALNEADEITADG